MPTAETLDESFEKLRITALRVKDERDQLLRICKILVLYLKKLYLEKMRTGAYYGIVEISIAEHIIAKAEHIIAKVENK